MSNIYRKFKQLPINFSALGLEQFPSASDYFCTPKGAKIIGWAGVDGIHYCFIREFGEMVFAVSPSNLPGDYVHPLANTFEDFLRLMLACHGLDAVEQAHAWGKDKFEEYLLEYPASPEQVENLGVLKKELGLTPMEQPFDYIKGIQDAFDYTKLRFKKEYEEYVPQEIVAGEEKQKERKVAPEDGSWKVYFGEGMRHHRQNRGRAGMELPVYKQFEWNENVWHIPSIYVCGKGLVVDFCVEIEPEKIKEFLAKVELYGEREERWSEEVREEMHRSNPTDISFRPEIMLNGRLLRQRNGLGFGWMPQELQTGGEACPAEPEVEELIEHYGLDRKKGWYFQRTSFAWATVKKPVIKEVELTLRAEEVPMTAKRFNTPAVGESITIVRPATGEEYTLTAQVVEEQQIDVSRLEQMYDGGLEFPSHYKMMTYILSPEFPGTQFLVQDCVQSDQPRKKSVPEDSRNAGQYGASAIAIIGGADGPTAVFFAGPDGSKGKPLAACSALHFEPVNEVEWKAVFREKLCEDLKVKLL